MDNLKHRPIGLRSVGPPEPARTDHSFTQRVYFFRRHDVFRPNISTNAAGARINHPSTSTPRKGDFMSNLIAQWLRTLQLRREAGQGLVEYALIIVLVAVVSIAILTTLGTSVASVFSRANAAL